ncbi:MAG: 3-dehydroquinate synthase [Planctomycetaceae bacterium]|nr:3-dehydroquinate synthase [Planctomycetaceae bacterium]
MNTVILTLHGPEHKYTIYLRPGAGADWQRAVADIVPANRYLLLADDNMAAHLALPADGERFGNWRCLRVLPGEEHKNLDQYASLVNAALQGGMDRDTVLVALGGGVTGDIAGFVAGTLLRGVRLVQVPTTLLAMVDSSVGGKNGVNTPAGKNLVGTFHQPAAVLIDPSFLDTLPRREYRAGLAEVVKTAVLDNQDFFTRLEDTAPALAAGDHAALADAISTCCWIKGSHVMTDEKDTGMRQLLNLGHTFGHVLESLAGFNGSVVHGEAVSVGTVLATDFAARHGFFDSDGADRIRALLARLGLPTRIAELGRTADAASDIDVSPPDWQALLGSDQAVRALVQDKKSSGGKVNLVLPHGFGDCRVDKGYDAVTVVRFMRDNI